MASIPDNYEINVAKDGKHFCRIQLSESFDEKAEEKLNIIRQIFGDDYQISMTLWTCRGTHKEGWE